MKRREEVTYDLVARLHALAQSLQEPVTGIELSVVLMMNEIHLDEGILSSPILVVPLKASSKSLG